MDPGATVEFWSPIQYASLLLKLSGGRPKIYRTAVHRRTLDPMLQHLEFVVIRGKTSDDKEHIKRGSRATRTTKPRITEPVY